MRLANNLYTVLQAPDAAAPAPVYHIRFIADSDIYRGHFPGQPITPGVCLVQIVEELTEHYLSAPLALDKVNNVKFLKVVSPIDTPQVEVELSKISTDDTTVKVQAVIRDCSATYTKTSLTFAKR